MRRIRTATAALLGAAALLVLSAPPALAKDVDPPSAGLSEASPGQTVTVERHDRAPHGGVRTGLGGSAGTDTRQLATGGVLVAAGVGGFWLLRRRTTDSDRQL